VYILLLLYKNFSPSLASFLPKLEEEYNEPCPEGRKERKREGEGEGERGALFVIRG
jgi:hypothetical protein